MSKQVRPPNKAAEFFGIDKGVSELATVTVQIQGTILLKENAGKARKRFCVVKDGFFIWYDKAPAESKENRLSFDKKPMGLFPLNMALVKLLPSKTEILLRHNEIPKSELVLIPEGIDVSDWLNKLNDGTASTWEKARLGIADLESLRAKGTKLEEEKLEAVKLLEAKIKELELANQKKSELIEKDKVQIQKFEKQYGEAVAELEGKENKLKQLKKKFEAEDKEMKTLNEKNVILEKKLKKAHVALQKLDRDLQEYFGHGLSQKKRGSSSIQVQMASIGSPNASIQTSAEKAMQRAMVSSSPGMRQRRTAPLISDMGLPRVQAGEGTRELSPPKLGSRPQTVSRDVVAASVRAIKVYIDRHRNEGERNSEDDD